MNLPYRIAPPWWEAPLPAYVRVFRWLFVWIFFQGKWPNSTYNGWD